MLYLTHKWGRGWGGGESGNHTGATPSDGGMSWQGCCRANGQRKGGKGPKGGLVISAPITVQQPSVWSVHTCCHKTCDMLGLCLPADISFLSAPERTEYRAQSWGNWQYLFWNQIQCYVIHCIKIRVESTSILILVPNLTVFVISQSRFQQFVWTFTLK